MARLFRLPRWLRLPLLAGAGISTFYVAAQWSGSQQETTGGAVDAAGRPAQPAASSARLPNKVAPAPEQAVPQPIFAIDRARHIPRSAGDPFAVLSWLPPPPPPPPPPAPAPPPKPVEPVAPPLPFVFVGMLERGAEKSEAFLAKGETLFVVSVGDKLEGNTYRVDALNANELILTYLPLNTPQTLNVAVGAK